MDVPLTSAGKPCKLCKAKGRKCHLHGGTPGTPKSGKSSPRSPKRTPSPKRSPVRRLSPNTKPTDLDDLFGSFESPKTRANRITSPPKEFHRYNELRGPALQQVMLNLDWDDLMNLCATNKRANTIFNNQTFLKMWNARNMKPIFKKPIKLTDKEKVAGLTRLEFVDANGTQIVVYIDKNLPEIKIMWKNGAWVVFSGGGVMLRIYEDIFNDDNENWTIDDKKFFDLIKHPEWYESYQKGGESREKIVKLIIMELRAVLGSEVPKKFYDKFLK